MATATCLAKAIASSPSNSGIWSTTCDRCPGSNLPPNQSRRTRSVHLVSKDGFWQTRFWEGHSFTGCGKTRPGARILGGAALQCVRENRLVFWGKMRQVRRYVTFSALQSGSSVLAAAQRERRVGRRSPEYFPAPRGGAVGYDRVRERVQR